MRALDPREAIRGAALRVIAAEPDSAKRLSLMDHLVAIENEGLWFAVPVARDLLKRVMRGAQ